MDARLRKLSDYVRPPSARTPFFSLETLLGRFVELSGGRASGVLSAAFGLVLEAQQRGEIVAWVSLPHGTFFPPDVHDVGVDLDTLVVVRVPDAAAAGRAADQLLRSGGFGLVVLDLAGHVGDTRLPAPLQSRLGGLAQKHDAALVVLTGKAAERASLGALVSLRAEARREGQSCVVQALKDKRHGPSEARRETCRLPDGLPQDAPAPPTPRLLERPPRTTPSAG